MNSGLEMEWDYSGRKGRDGQKKKICKANERKRKVKGGKDKVNGQGGKGCPGSTRGSTVHEIIASVNKTQAFRWRKLQTEADFYGYLAPT